MERSSNPNPNNSGSHMVHGFRNQTENRDAPKFEKRERDTTSRFFGQGPVVSDADDGEVVERSRPPPGMAIPVVEFSGEVYKKIRKVFA